MSRPDRLNEEQRRYFLGFDEKYGDDLQKAKEALLVAPSENEGQRVTKRYLKEWIVEQESPIDQKAFQDAQIKVAKDANNIAIAAFVVSAIALLISLLK